MNGVEAIKNNCEDRIQNLFNRYSDKLYWVSVQVQHPRTQEDFYAIAGSGYEAPQKERTWITILREIYRRIDKKCRIYDYVLFGDSLRLKNGIYKISISSGGEFPKIRFSPFEAEISYPRQAQEFWEKYINPDTSLSVDNYESFSHYLSSNMGVMPVCSADVDATTSIEERLYDDVEKIRSLSAENKTENSDLLIGSLLFPWKYLYYGTIDLAGSSTVKGGITIATKMDIDENLMVSLVSQLKEISIGWLWDLSDSYREKYAVNSAIGSIMSRNGSHNIGSHVLAALSHNVGTMPDDRVLYQYIQHRMDYIATATTERPVWTMPTKFVSSMMRRFLSQRHLLDYVSRSEGLKAYQFQNPHEDTSKKNCQPGTIRVHIRRIDDNDAWWDPKEQWLISSGKPMVDFIDYPKGETSHLDRDVDVAIPGGVIGQHAFFTILENILRNAAKHEWAVLQEPANPVAEKDKTGDAQQPAKPRHLDLYVDFQDRPREGRVEVVVWSDCGGKSFDTEIQNLSIDDINKKLDEDSSSGKLDLEGLSPLQRLQVKMARSFIASDGHLHKENWGLAEMRISAGYLNIAKIEDIGGISQSKKRFDIIRPVVVEKQEEEGMEKRRCLGYRFSIPKPKELLVILPDSMIRAEENPDEIKSAVERFSDELKRFGVAVTFESTLEECSGSNAALPFSHVLFKGCPSVLEKLKLGRRLLSAEPPSPSTLDRAQYHGDLFDKEIDAILASDPESFANDLLKQVYIDWMAFVKKSYRDKNHKPDNMEFPLVIDVFGEKNPQKSGTSSSSGAEQSLIADAELLDFIFKNTFNSAVDSYVERNKLHLNPEVRRGLQLWREEGFREVHVESRRPEIGEDGAVVDGKFVQLTREGMIRRQLEKWCDRKYKTTEDQMFMQKMKAWLEAWDDNPRDRNVPRDLKDFVGYLGSVIFDQARAILCKYEERIVTLPEAMEVKFEGEVATDQNSPGKEIGGQRIIFTSSDDYKNSPECTNAIAYWRHENYKTERKNSPVYLEALSGAQSYFSVFSELGKAVLDGNDRELNREETGVVAKLVECGLTKILIVDERVARFVSEHQDVKEAFSHIGIDVLDADSSKTVEMFKKEDSLSLAELKSYDIAIVHQGVIDKRLHDSEALSSVDEFCVRMEENVSCFAITTGRGTPSTIPPNARVLPFSVIESTLFARYPEKFILVNTVMNLLPIGKQEGQ